MPLDKTFEMRFGEHEYRTVRESVATLIKTIPIDITLSTSGTAEDVISLESNSLPAYNAITNPSMETGSPPTGWVAVGSALASVQSGTIAPRTGVDSLQINTDNSAAGEGAYFEVTTMSQGSYSFSIYVRRAAGGTVRLRATHDNLTTSTDSAVLTMNDTWQRMSVTHLVTGAVSSSLRLYVVTDVQQDITFFAEDAMIEPAWGVIIGTANSRDPSPAPSSVSEYIDPSGDRYSRWLGTTDASASVREPTIGEILELHLEVVNADLYIEFDRTAARTGSAISILLRAGDTINGKKIIKNNISFINSVAGQLPRLRGFVLGQ